MSVRRARSLAILVGLPAVAAILLWATIVVIQRPASTGVGAAVPSFVTEKVQERVLETTVIARGDVVEMDTISVAINGDVGGLEGEPIYTGRVARVGSRVRNGSVLVEVSGRPIILLEGTIPMYRQLGLESIGADVEQLERQLGRLGYFTGTPDRTFGSSTTSAVQALYRDLGYEPMRALPNSGDNLTAEDADPGQTPAVVVPRGEIVFARGLPRKVGTVSVIVGQVPAGVAFALKGADAAVEVKLPRDQAALVTKGATAAFFDAGSTVEMPGRVLGISKRADAQGNHAIRISVRGAFRGSVGANVRVRISVATSGRAVLAVSPAAIHTAEDGRTYVDRVEKDSKDAEHATRIEVRLGLVADSLVEVAPLKRVLKKDDRLVVAVR